MGLPDFGGVRLLEFAEPGELRRQLINLVLHGSKRATAGLLSDYEAENEAIEHVGELMLIVDDHLQPLATVCVTRVEICRFADVPDEFALAEAEGDLNAEDFRRSHLEYWTSTGVAIADDTLIVQVYFDLLAPD